MGIQLPVGERDLFQHSLFWGMILCHLVKRFQNSRARNVVIFTGLYVLPRTLFSPEICALRSLIHPTEQVSQLLCCDKLSSQEINLSSKESRQNWSPNKVPCGIYFSGVSGRVVDRANPHGSEVRNAWCQATSRPNMLA